MAGEADAGAGAERLARGARRVSALTMLSRLLGLVREQVFAVTLGAGAYSDAFLAAFRIPNLLRDLFAEGALSTAFVPTYVKTLRNESRAAAIALANRVVTTLAFYLGVLALVAMAFPEPVVHLVATGFSPAKAELTATLVRIMMPFLPVISLAVVAMGALNAEENYTSPALASSMFNLVAIIGGIVVWLIAPSPVTAVVTWACLTLVGGVAQLVVQVPSLWRTGFRPRLLPDLRLRDPGTRRIAMLMAPATLGVAAVQVNVVVNSSFASLISDGALSWLSYAFRLMQLPIGVFGVAVATTALTHLSRDAAAQDWDALRGTLRRGLRMVLFLTVPSTVGLALLGVPDHPPDLRARAVLARRHHRDGARAVRVRRRAGRVRGDQGRRAGVLRARPHARAGHRQHHRRRRQPDLELRDLPALRPRRAGAGDVGGGAGQLRRAGVRVPAPVRRPADARAARAAGAHRRRQRGDGRGGVGAVALARDACPPAGAAMFAAKALIPIGAGIAVYFGAARVFGLEEARVLLRRFRR